MDLIDRQAAIDEANAWLLDCFKVQKQNRSCGLIRRLEDLPSAQPERNGFSVIDIKTGEEADPYEIALHEEWAKNLMYCDMEGFAIEEDGSLILVDECGRYEYCPIGRFEVRWS